MGSTINLRDNYNTKDNLGYARTKITAGYDPYIDSRNGVTKFGTTVFETENMILLGGSLFTFEKVFNLDYFRANSTGDNVIQNSLYIDELFGLTNDHTVSEAFPQKDNAVCLFGVGINGAGEAITDVKDVNYYERVMYEGGSAPYGLVPFRQISDSEVLSDDDKTKYWLRNDVVTKAGEPKIAYYLKSFETQPEIFTLYRDNGEDDGSPVTGTPWVERPETPIETFIQMTLKISKKDIREYFIDNEEVEKTRFNSIGLFSGIRTRVIRNGVEYDDYRQVRMFSKLNINNEMLTPNKDLTISYRIYTV